ncbi:MAG: sulfotransferase, partial [Candidatus Rokuibacteriota bacterium]
RWEPLLADLLAFRRTGPGTAQVYDVHYARLMTDPLGTARAIYEHFHRRWDVVLESRMAAFVAEERRARRPGQHRYRAEQFGLTPDRIDEAFAAYCRVFGVDRE